MTWLPSWGPAPRWATPRDPSRASFGPVVGRLCRRLTGQDLHPWQQHVLDVALEVLPDGGWAYEEISVTVPRQSGKTFLVAPVVGHRMGRAADRQAWITAQNGDKAVRRWAAASRVLAKSMPGVRQLVSTAHERTVWPNGSQFLPFTPKEAAVDGETPDLIWIDEQWAFDGADQAAMESSFGPAVFMNPWGQVWKTSTAGTQLSAWLNADRLRGRAAVEAGRNRGLAIFEWGIPDDEDPADMDDGVLVDLILAHHPLTGHHPKITREALLGELDGADATKRASFIRGLGNLTMETRGDGLVPDPVWTRTAARALVPTGVRFGLGVAVDELGRESSIVAGYRDPDTGIGVVELVESGSGSGWVAQRVKNITGREDVGITAVHYSGPGRAAGDAMLRLGVPVLKVWSPDVSAATTRFLEDLDRERQQHDGHRGPEMTCAMRAASTTRLKAGPMIVPSGHEPVTAVQAAVLAMWAADHLPEEAPPPPPPFEIR